MLRKLTAACPLSIGTWTDGGWNWVYMMLKKKNVCKNLAGAEGGQANSRCLERENHNLATFIRNIFAQSIQSAECKEPHKMCVCVYVCVCVCGEYERMYANVCVWVRTRAHPRVFWRLRVLFCCLYVSMSVCTDSRLRFSLPRMPWFECLHCVLDCGRMCCKSVIDGLFLLIKIDLSLTSVATLLSCVPSGGNRMMDGLCLSSPSELIAQHTHLHNKRGPAQPLLTRARTRTLTHTHTHTHTHTYTSARMRTHTCSLKTMFSVFSPPSSSLST